uniref:Uncharacterized protein n=1 Tax=Tetranychus urticae TaxID=32264 RepID=T1JU52_TETUR
MVQVKISCSTEAGNNQKEQKMCNLLVKATANSYHAYTHFFFSIKLP